MLCIKVLIKRVKIVKGAKLKFKIFKRNRNEEAYKKAILKRSVILLQNQGFKDVQMIGHGGFREVMKAKRAKTKEVVAVKLTDTENRWPLEKELWSTFDHENVISILEARTVGCFDIFVMTLHETALDTILNEKNFSSEPSALEDCIGWLKDILFGLAYLHERVICHLVIKSNNILMTKDRKAVLIESSCVNTSKELVHR